MAENIAAAMFNGMATNLMREYNSNIHAGKNAQPLQQHRQVKIKKLTTMKRVTQINKQTNDKTTTDKQTKNQKINKIK